MKRPDGIFPSFGGSVQTLQAARPSCPQRGNLGFIFGHDLLQTERPGPLRAAAKIVVVQWLSSTASTSHRASSRQSLSFNATTTALAVAWRFWQRPRHDGGFDCRL